MSLFDEGLKLLSAGLAGLPAQPRDVDPFAGDFDAYMPEEVAVVDALDFLSIRYIGDKGIMTKGNSKLDKRVLIFNLPPVKTCPNSSSCRDTCYAVPFYRQYPGVWEKCDQNLKMAKERPKDLAGRLKYEVREKVATRAGLVAVRVHSSGDFFSQEYVNLWAGVAKEIPTVNFYAYTKADKVFDFGALDELPNFNVIRSFIRGKYRNYGPPEYVKKVKDQVPEAFICPAIHNKAVHCGGECNYCITGPAPLFYIHGSMKKAGPLTEHKYDWKGLEEERAERRERLRLHKAKKAAQKAAAGRAGSQAGAA